MRLREDVNEDQLIRRLFEADIEKTLGLFLSIYRNNHDRMDTSSMTECLPTVFSSRRLEECDHLELSYPNLLENTRSPFLKRGL